MPLFVTYKYTKNELKRALLSIQSPPFIFYLISAIFFFISIGFTIGIIFLGVQNFSVGGAVFIFILMFALFVLSFWLFSKGPKNAREMTELFSAEQTVSIIGGELTYIVGANIFKIKSQYIYKIVKNDYF